MSGFIYCDPPDLTRPSLDDVKVEFSNYSINIFHTVKFKLRNVHEKYTYSKQQNNWYFSFVIIQWFFWGVLMEN